MLLNLSIVVVLSIDLSGMFGISASFNFSLSGIVINAISVIIHIIIVASTFQVFTEIFGEDGDTSSTILWVLSYFVLIFIFIANIVLLGLNIKYLTDSTSIMLTLSVSLISVICVSQFVSILILICILCINTLCLCNEMEGSGKKLCLLFRSRCRLRKESYKRRVDQCNDVPKESRRNFRVFDYPGVSYGPRETVELHECNGTPLYVRYYKL